MSHSIIGVHHYHLRHRHPPADVTTPDGHPAEATTEQDPSVIAEHAMEAAKGGHIVALHLPNTPDPVMVHPDDDHPAVVAKLAPHFSDANDAPPWTSPPVKPGVDEAGESGETDDGDFRPVGGRRGRKPAIPLDE